MQNFVEFLMDKYKHLSRAYNDDIDKFGHFMSGEVTVPFKEVAEAFYQWESLRKQAPQAKFQNDDHCHLDFGKGMATILVAKILKIHTSRNGFQYDVEALVQHIDDAGICIGYNRVRFYNVDEQYIVEYKG